MLRVGPVGEWYANDSLIVLLDALTHEPLRAGVYGYGYGDVQGLGGWCVLRGRLRCDPSLSPGAGRLRCGIELWAEGERDPPLFSGWIEVGTRAPSASLRADLESFGLRPGG